MNKTITFQSDPIICKKMLLEWLYFLFDKKTLIINDTRASIIPEVLPHIEFVGCYDQRILPILQDTSIVFSTPFFQEIQKYYQTFWLAQWVQVITIQNKKENTLGYLLLNNQNILSKIQSLWMKKILPFFINDDMQKISENLNIPLNISRDIFLQANNKLLLKKYLQWVNLPTLNGCFTNDLDVIQKYFFQKERYLFKDPFWVSGYGFWDNHKNSIDEIVSQYQQKQLIIEKYIETIASPSVQFFIDEKNKTQIIFGITDQILQDWKIYMWNTFPSVYTGTKIWDELLQQAQKILEYIVTLWYTWFWWIDFILSKDNKIYATEVNARFTAATYPCVTSLLLYGDFNKKWKYYNQDVPPWNLSQFLKEECMQVGDIRWKFPIGCAGYESWGKINILEFT